MRVGFTCGSFDLLHAGHVLMLEECREQCDYLLVGLQTDPTIDRGTQKNKPVQTVMERWIQLEAIRHVDAIRAYETEADLLNLLNTEQIDVRFVGPEYRSQPFTGQGISEIKVVYNRRRHNYSSSELRRRIIESQS